MRRATTRTSSATSAALLLAMGMPVGGCGAPGDVDVLGVEAEPWRQAEPEAEPVAEGQSIPMDTLSTTPALELVDTYLQRLPEPTPAGENVVLHMHLPAPHDPALTESLVRVLGSEDDPLVVFRTDALVSLGQLAQSPGPEFFTAFLSLDEAELERRVEMEAVLAQSPEPSETLLHFQGRTPVALTTGLAFDMAAFTGGGVVALGPCPITPASTQARWGESLMITDLGVVQDPTRTFDVCGPGGDPDGVWTFKHLVTQMAMGSGMTPEAFVEDWLDHWLHTYTVNGDDVPTRESMFHLVIAPWAAHSGVTASITPVGLNDFVLAVGGPLDLDLSPFKLAAIVNRIDLGATTAGVGGYGDGTTHDPLDAGELRFVFGVQDLNGGAGNCNTMPFSVIFEYGVPITSCPDVRDWALQWTLLNDPAFATPFDTVWRTHLEGLTQSVVLHGAAPSRGNQSALNQIRTNENALDGQWELREFTLSVEDPFLDTNTPANGPLRAHTVAMTPDDTAFNPPSVSVNVDSFVQGPVASGVPPQVSTLPVDCEASYFVPGFWNGDPFRGGNSFAGAPDFWGATINASDPVEVCARHQFSLNTCNGCHLGDTATGFLHVDPQSSPAGLSEFLTGGLLGIWSVNDSQLGSPTWTFRDLDRRFGRLYEIACAECGSALAPVSGSLAHMAEVAGAVPLDSLIPSETTLSVGPVLDLGAVELLLSDRHLWVDAGDLRSVELDGVVRVAVPMVH